MRNQIGIIVTALDAEAEAQATKGGIMGVPLHSMLCAIASRIQKAEADFARLHPSGQHVETRKPVQLVAVDQPTGRFTDALTAQERDEARRQLNDAKKTLRDMLKAREDRIADLEACGERQAATIKDQDKKIATLESEMQDAAGLRKALDMAEAACTAQADRADALQADAHAAWNFAGIESDGMPTPEGPGRWGRIEEMTRRHVQAIQQWQARAERAEKALAADTLDIVRTFHNEGAQPGESLARYVARNVETLRAALRTALLPLTLLTHHRGQFRPEDGLLDRMAKLAQRPQS